MDSGSDSRMQRGSSWVTDLGSGLGSSWPTGSDLATEKAKAMEIDSGSATGSGSARGLDSSWAIDWPMD